MVILELIVGVILFVFLMKVLKPKEVWEWLKKILGL